MKTTAIRYSLIAALLTMGACSTTPSTEEVLASKRVQSAPFELVTTERGQLLTLTDVLFDSGQAELRPEADGIIAKAASYIENNNSRIAIIEGHTDRTGTAAYNVALSEARAESVREALIAKGVAAHRLETKGYGETRPVATNVTADGRQQNRRVEILFTSADASGTFTLL